MNDHDAGALPADDIGPPLPELEALRMEPSERFVPNVLDGINTRQTTAQAFELTWWGFTDLFMEFIQTLFRVIGLEPEDSEEGEP